MNGVVTTLAISFLIGSSSFLLTTSKPIKSWMCSTGPWTVELAALGPMKNLHRLIPIDLLQYSVLFLLSPYLCFISFLYPDLYVLGDDALIS